MLFIGFALVLILNALPLSMGTARNIGPGYFPLALAGLLLMLGIGTIVSGIRRTDEANIVGEFDWRGMFIVGAAMLAFALSVRPLGFIPALALATIIASFAPPQISLKRTI